MTQSTVGITQSNLPAGFIDLGLGHPADDLLPLDLMAQATAQRFAMRDSSFLQYGSEAGGAPFREALAEFLQQETGVDSRAESLLITNGVSQALDLICTLLTRPGDVVIVEEPTYFLALRIFADHGLTPVAGPTDSEGLDIDWLEEVLKGGVRPALLYTVPTHQNPSGVTLSAERRLRLVDLSSRYGFRVVADEVYHLLTFDGTPPPPLAGWTDEPSVMSLGSFSKILAPGLRLGWMQAAPEQLQRFSGCGLLDSGGGLNPFTGAMVQSVLEMNLLAPSIARLKSVYKERRDILAEALRREIPRARFALPAGGYFLWVDLGEGVDAATVSKRAEALHVGVRIGAKFVPPAPAGSSPQRRSRHDSAVRLCFAYYDGPQLEEGVRRLASALHGFP